jgi:N-acetylmuramoyl-L-alanine amidase
MKLVLIDAGHGGEDVGALGMLDDNEARINLMIALHLERLLKEEGRYNLMMTRSSDIDVSLQNRLAMVRANKPDAFVSIHCNAYEDSRAHGMEVLYADEYDEPLAYELSESMQDLPMRDRGMKKDTEWLGHKLRVLRDLHTPAVLVECGFITNPGDYMEVTQYVRMARTIKRGLFRYFARADVHG